MIKKGIRAHDVATKGLKNICLQCEQNKIEYLQLVLEKSVEDFKNGNFSKDYALKLKQMLGNTKVAVLGSYINPSTVDESELSDYINRFKEKIHYASIIKPLVVGTETGRFIKGNDTKEAYLHLLRTMKHLVSEAEKYDVNIGIEGVHCFVINTPQKMARLISDLNSPNVKVIFDPVNYINISNYMSQEYMICSMFELLSEKIAVVHAKDFIVDDNKIKLTIPGHGLLNYQLLFEKIKQFNLNVPIITEEISIENAKVFFEKSEKEYYSV